MKKVGQLFREGLVNQIKKGIDENANVFLLSYSNISGIKISGFRKNLEQADADVFVSKNSAAQVALKELKHDKLAERISGQTAFVWSNKDAVEIAKLIVKFEEEVKNIEFKGGLIEGKEIEPSDIKKLSDLPSKEVLLAMLFSAIQSPLTRLAGALNAKTRDLLSILKQLSEKKGGK